ncbi:MAG: FAD-dependent oxidoreductase, partial [Desulfobulbus sp.]|nr:FAD-dependent oxidoreductase [Desulfobulbus sp.]
MRFVIIGGDAAGMSAASRAKRNNAETEVIVLEQGRDVSYSACNIPYNIADPEREIDDLVVRSAAAFRENQQIDLRTGHRVDWIDRAAKTVHGTTLEGAPFSVSYDQLLIATGATPLRPRIGGMDLPGVFVVKNLEDGRGIKAFLGSRKVRRAVIIGMGYIALEMAEALTERGIQVDMIKPRQGLLPWMDSQLSQQVRDHLEQHGVGLYDGRPIERIIVDGDHLQVVSTPLLLDCDLVVVAIGVKPN